MIALVRSKTVKEPLNSRLLFPLTERAFVHGRYERLLDRLADARRLRVVPLDEFRSLADGERVVVGLRHDVDDRLENALRLAELERDRGLRATYFVLHTAPYWRESDLLDKLERLQELGHEIGFHNDLVTLERLEGIDVGAYLRRELDRLRSAGIRIRGAAAHGSPWCHALGFHNNYVFAGWDEPVPGFPSTDVRTKLEPSDFGLEYEAYHLDYGHYFSDAAFDARGRRRHPESLELERIAPGERLVILAHPCHWDASLLAKHRRLAGCVLGRAARYAGKKSRASTVTSSPRS